MITKTSTYGRMAAAGAATMLLLLAPQPRPAVSAQGSTKVIIYRLKKGEGFSDVARKYGVPLSTIIKMNRARLARPNDPSYVFPGMNVKVPVRVKPAAAAAAPKKPAPAPPAPPAPPAQPVAKQPPAKAAVPPAAAPAQPETPPAAKPAPAPREAPVPAAPAPPAAVREQQPAPAAPADALPWSRAALWTIAAAALALVLVMWYYLRRLANDLKALRAGDHSPLTLVAQRELSKDSSIYWIRVGEKDLFITTGEQSRISETDPAASPATAAPEPANGAAEPGPSAGRRPRKNPPGITTG